MAIRKVVVKTCDRCGRNEEAAASQSEAWARDADEGPPPIIEVNVAGALVGPEAQSSPVYGFVKFEDLCQRCEGRVKVLLNQLKNIKAPRAAEGNPEGS